VGGRVVGPLATAGVECSIRLEGRLQKTGKVLLQTRRTRMAADSSSARILLHTWSRYTCEARSCRKELDRRGSYSNLCPRLGNCKTPHPCRQVCRPLVYECDSLARGTNQAETLAVEEVVRATATAPGVMAGTVEKVVDAVEPAARVAMAVVTVATEAVTVASRNSLRAYEPRGMHGGPGIHHRMPPCSRMRSLHRTCVNRTFAFHSDRLQFLHGSRNSCLRRRDSACHRSR
jgi:hypothetical protein